MSILDFAMGLYPKESRIAAAKRNAVGGKRKRCTKGKNCSAACIAANMVCLVDLPWAGPSLTKVAQVVQKKKAGQSVSTPAAQPKVAPAPVPTSAPAPAPTQPKPAPNVKPAANSPYYVQSAYGFDKNFDSTSARKEGDVNFNKWGDSYDPQTKKLGQGAFGTVLMNPDGTVVKRGIISDTEAAIIKKAGDAGVSAKLIAAEIGPKNGIKTSAPVQMHDGRIAMTKVEGKPAEQVAGQTLNGVTAADSFWKARAALHKTGIAHNDMHSDNVLVDNKGKGTVIDLGFAQDSPKAALSEALGAFKAPSAGTAIPGVGKQKGDWQVRQWNGTAGFRLQDAENMGLNSKAGAKLLQEAPYLHRIYSQNLPKVFSEMKKMGYSDDEIKTVAITGIKNKLDTYEKGPWSKMTDADALKLTNILYEGS
jgi:hypothetical protein